MRRESIVPLIAGSLLMWLSGCGDADAPYNVVLITVDTLRADHLHYAGHPRPSSPAIDQLAESGLIFPNSYSVSGWTLPSIATLMTGRYPKDHGSTDFRYPINAALPTLPEILKRAGYSTRAYVSHFMLNEKNGFARGFDVFDSSVRTKGNPHDISSSKEITDLALEGIRGSDEPDEPFFIWAHYFDPHFAYLSHPGFALFGGDEIDRYDQEIAYTDLQIGRLLDALDMDDTIVIFTADHGEEFGEHGGRYHYTMYDEVIRTPLILKAPGIAPGSASGVAEQIDVLPTLLGLLDLPNLLDLPDRADAALPGRDLLDPRAEDGPAFFERDRPPPWRQRGVRVGHWMFWLITELPIESVPLENQRTAIPVSNVVPGLYLYDVSVDPEQKVNLYDRSDPRSLQLLGLVTRHFERSRDPTHRLELDEETRQRLRDLGYVDGRGAVPE